MKSTPEVKNLLARLSPFPGDFFIQDTVEVAKALIGSYLVHFTDAGILAGRIVETEAYMQDDPASHSFRGTTDRNRWMFHAGGIAYVYFIYGMYNCFNVVTGPKGIGCAVLIRAIEPVYNGEIMWTNRFPGKAVNPRMMHGVANGPGKLCRAMNITRDHNGTDLSSGGLKVLKNANEETPRISASGRVGINRGRDLPWRFFDAGSGAVSR